MLKDIFEAVNLQTIDAAYNYQPNQLRHHIKINHKALPDLDDALDNVDLAMFGVAEYRNAKTPHSELDNIEKIRQAFYQLYNHQAALQMLDFGNIILGETAYDTYHAVCLVVEKLLEQNIIPVIIGGSQDLTNGQFLGYLPQNKLVNVGVVDEKIDLYSSDEKIDNSTYLFEMLNNQASRLYNIGVLGYQLHLVDPLIVETLNNMHFNTHRLGSFKEDITELEPTVRNANLLSFDLRAIRQADAKAALNQSPNGFTALEACRLCWYAGISDALSSIGFYEYASSLDDDKQTASLIAQMMAYFVEGFYQRKNDVNPIKDQSLKYTVSFNEENLDIDFIKSKKSDRWWMLLPKEMAGQEALNHQRLIPCSYNDYLDACNKKIPTRWLKATEKITAWRNQKTQPDSFI